MGVLTMINDFFKKLNTETLAGFFLVVKLGFALFLKRWMEHCADAIFSALKQYRGLLWLPSLILLVWFPVSSVIDACLIVQHQSLAIWWCCVDLYMSYFLAVVFRTFMKRLSAEQKVKPS